MDAAWWAGDWEIETYIPGTSVSVASIAASSLNSLWDIVSISGVERAYVREYSYGSNSAGYRVGGAFLVRNATTGELTMPADINKSNEYNNEFYPINYSSASIEKFDELPVKYTNPFTWSAAPHHSDYLVIVTSTPTGSPGDTFEIAYRAPYAFEGMPAEVIAAIFLKLGIDSSWLDTAAFDNAYDGQYYDIGTGGSENPDILYAREIGVTLADSIKEIAAHSWDFIGYNMAGQLTMESRTRPTTTTGLAGLISLTHRVAHEHLVNKIRVTYGMVNRTTTGNYGEAPTEISGGEEVANSNYTYRSEWDPTLRSALDDTWTQTYSDSTSITKYGTISPAGNEDINDDGNVKSVPATHKRFFMEGPAAHGYAMRVGQFSEPLRELTATQDFRGMDYDIGHAVTNVAVTGDGDTIADLRCISKEIDFNNFTVTSVLLEEK